VQGKLVRGHKRKNKERARGNQKNCKGKLDTSLKKKKKKTRKAENNKVKRDGEGGVPTEKTRRTLK